MLIYSFITDYQAFNLRYKDNTARDKNETKVGKQSANLGKNNEPIQNRLSFLIDCKSVILHHLTILSFPMVRPSWDNWRICKPLPRISSTHIRTRSPRVFAPLPLSVSCMRRRTVLLDRFFPLKEKTARIPVLDPTEHRPPELPLFFCEYPCTIYENVVRNVIR